jgi:hypothetical protein
MLNRGSEPLKGEAYETSFECPFRHIGGVRCVHQRSRTEGQPYKKAGEGVDRKRQDT